MTAPKRLLTLAEAAESVGHSVETLRRAIRSADVSTFPPPLRAKVAAKGRYGIKPADLDAWVDSLPDA